MLIFQCILGLHSKSINLTIDFVNAGIQSGDPIFIEPLRYLNIDGYQWYVVLWLKKRLHGQSKDTRLWFENLRNGLLYRNFVVSKVDPCLFMSKNIIFVVYVDYCLFWVFPQSEIDYVNTSFKEDGPGL